LLVAIQIALSLAILVNAIYIVQLRLDLAARPSGIANEEQVFRLDVSNHRWGGPEDQFAVQKQEEATLRAVPGVVSVARTNSSPMSRSGSNTGLAVDRKQATATVISSFYLSPGSLIQTWGLKLVQGRDFLPEEIQELDQEKDKDFPDPVIITQALARKLYPGESQFLGKVFYFGTGSDASAAHIVGVVERLQTAFPRPGDTGEFSTLIPVRLANDPYSGYTIRAAPGQRDRVMNAASEALRKASSAPLNIQMRTVEQHRQDCYRSEKGLAWMLIAVCSLLIIVTASGIVGMSTLWVAQRRKQIGVRRALGARKVDVLRYFFTENLLITTGGIVVGLALSLALNQLLVSQFELSKLPLHYLLIAPLVFWTLGLLAVYAPAWRAASTPPATATRGI
ncbi:MAG: FtsX-like permease family protein, partial [Burkholderiales bacterium]|nr:FtsX-like permease family protein [Burkholderiales bacterium]